MPPDVPSMVIEIRFDHPKPLPERAEIGDLTGYNFISMEMDVSGPMSYLNGDPEWVLQVTGEGIEVEACYYDANGCRSLAKALLIYAEELDERNDARGDE